MPERLREQPAKLMFEGSSPSRCSKIEMSRACGTFDHMSYEPDPAIYEPDIEKWMGRYSPRVKVRHGHPNVFESVNFGQGSDGEFGANVNHRCDDGERKVRVYNKDEENERRVVEMSPEEAERIVEDQAEGIIAEMIEAGPQEFSFIVTETVARRVRVSAFSMYEANAIALRMLEQRAVPGAAQADVGTVTSRRAMHLGSRPMESDKAPWDSVEAEEPADWTAMQGDTEAIRRT